MGISAFIARIFGLLYLVVGIGLIKNRQTFKQIMEDFSKNTVLVFYGGILALVIGLMIVLTHNIWVANWTVIITIIGWGALIKGVWLIIFPNSVHKFMQTYQKNENLLKIHPIVALVLGIVLTYFGFFSR